MLPASCGHNVSPPGRCSLLCSLRIWLGCLSEGLTRHRGRRFCYNHTRDEARRAPKQLRHAQPLYLCTVSLVKNVHILQLGRIYSFFTAFSAPWLFFFLLFCSFFFCKYPQSALPIFKLPVVQREQSDGAAAACGHRAAPAPLRRLPATSCQPQGGAPLLPEAAPGSHSKL